MLRILFCCGLLLSGNLVAQDIPALLDWQQRLELATLVEGRVSKVNVSVGQQVTRGTLLIEFDQREIQARLAWAEARVAAAQLQQDEARRELDRSLELYDRTLLSNHERIVAEIDAAKADALLRRAEAELEQIRMEREFSRIKAPFDGVVSEVKVQPGQVLVNRLMSMPLMTLIDPSRMKAVAEIDAQTAAQLQLGGPVKVGLRGEWVEGSVAWIGLEPISLEQGAVKYPLEVSLEPPPGPRAGEQVMVRIDE